MKTMVAQTIVFWTWRIFQETVSTQTIVNFELGEKNYSTQYSRVVPHHSTDCAITSLTSEIRRDPVLSGVYGRSYLQLLAKFEKEYILHLHVVFVALSQMRACAFDSWLPATIPFCVTREAF